MPSALPCRASRRLTRHALAAGLALVAAATRPLAAQPAAPPVPTTAAPAPQLDAATRRAIVDSVAHVLELRYVDSTIARRLGARLRERLATGAYERHVDAPALGTALMGDLQDVVVDKHLRVTYEPEREFGMAGPSPTGAGGGSGARLVGGSAASAPRRGPPTRVRMPIFGAPAPQLGGPSAASAPSAGAPAPGGGPTPWRRIDGRDSTTLARDNFAFDRIEVLPGNVGYLKLHEFVPLDLSRDTWIAALRFLRHVDALIVDVRDHRGGAPEAVQLLLSHFVREPMLLAASYNRAAHLVFERWTEADVPGPRLDGVPLFVVQNRNSGSSAETLGYVVQQHRLGTVVGDTTAGAGNGGSKLSVGGGLALFIPQFQIITGPGYERTGVAPDVWAPSEGAVAVAHRLALRQLTAGAPPEVARERAWALELLDAAARERRADDPPLAAFTGAFGNRRFEARGDALVHVGVTGTITPLARVDARTFRAGTVRFRFEGTDGAPAPAVTVEPLHGATVRNPRGAP